MLKQTAKKKDIPQHLMTAYSGKIEKRKPKEIIHSLCKATLWSEERQQILKLQNYSLGKKECGLPKIL